ncbi:uncharacterized protein K444DRAFT_330567 [Hyaloscypha bicolor E]|uniref:Uncharacterized protein n=1 Tax=Hyaloscypha bicolor E TaxID=1095630 RepID=A0A2J6TJQ3_9HELO|nr:uncharacterized protein K444DRAFT_330567 [Hyaloscypha bicolor E]PMD63247.1 hypothetical protein K444DRAFT_330567 [Hyaloscypha bicolor E]
MFPGILPFQPLMSYLHPSFMIQHLTQRSLKEFRRSVVADEQWESFGVDVQLLCLPWQPLHLNIRRYVPSCHLYSLQTQSNSQAMAIHYSLPVGIYKPAQKATTRRFNKYLDKLINNHLPDYARFMHNLRGFDHSSRTLEVLLLCFQEWKDKSINNPQCPTHELVLMENAIKLIAIQSFLGVGLILETIPAAFTHSPFPSPTGPQLAFPDNQIPRLLNRQIKTIFFAIYKTLLLQVLMGFKAVASNKTSWGTSVFVGICLAFLLERIEAGSQEYLFFAKSVYMDEEGGLGDAEAYSREVESVVFDRIYRILGSGVKMKTDGANAMALELLDSLRWVREGFSKFLCPSFSSTRINLP